MLCICTKSSPSLFMSGSLKTVRTCVCPGVAAIIMSPHTRFSVLTHICLLCAVLVHCLCTVCACGYSLQEDIESMQKELEGWRKENEDHADALRREERCALKKGQCNDHCMLCWCT